MNGLIRGQIPRICRHQPHKFKSVSFARRFATDINRSSGTRLPGYVPPAALELGVQKSRTIVEKDNPSSPSFFNAQSTYYDKLEELEMARTYARSALQDSGVYPVPAEHKEYMLQVHSLAPFSNRFKTPEEIRSMFGGKIKVKVAKQMLQRLSELDELRTISRYVGETDAEEVLQAVLTNYEQDGGASATAGDSLTAAGLQNRLKHLREAAAVRKMTLDEFGRSYAAGKRKESAARVWVIPTFAKSTTQEGATNVSPHLTTSQILVNNLPLSEYFPNIADREKVVRPLKVAGVLGGYNVFALVRGGGTSGQAGALSLGLSKALLPHMPDLKPIFRKADLTRRDPRAVERKKTGRVKARKKPTWVKR